MSSNQTPIPETEIEDWFSHPITELFFDAFRDIAIGIDDDKKNAFSPGEPMTTHERHSWCLGAEWMAGQLLDMADEKVIRRLEE